MPPILDRIVKIKLSVFKDGKQSAHTVGSERAGTGDRKGKLTGKEKKPLTPAQGGAQWRQPLTQGRQRELGICEFEANGSTQGVLPQSEIHSEILAEKQDIRHKN